jgi:hypothetical protein
MTVGMITARNERSDLALRIVHGALEDDLVQMHGAIVATLELYPIHEAECLVFADAVGRLARRPVLRTLAQTAIRNHVAVYADAA